MTRESPAHRRNGRLSDAELLDLLVQVRASLRSQPGAAEQGATPGGPEDRTAYVAALAALEAEAAARGLTLPSERERLPVAVARQRLARVLRRGAAPEALAIVNDLDARGLFTLFRRLLDRLSDHDRLALLEAIFERLDELHYDPPVAHRRRRRFLRPDLPLARRLERLHKAVAFQFRTLHRLQEEE